MPTASCISPHPVTSVQWCNKILLITTPPLHPKRRVGKIKIYGHRRMFGGTMEYSWYSAAEILAE
jgi:hypothetical protein